MNRQQNRTAFLIPDTDGLWGVLLSGALVLSGLDRFTATQWAADRGYRVRVLRTARAVS